MYRLLYRKSLTLEQARAAIAALAEQAPTAEPEVSVMLDFLASAARGIVR